MELAVSDCKFCPDSKCFFYYSGKKNKKGELIGTRMTGLTRVLREIFYPDYELVEPEKRSYENKKSNKPKPSQQPKNIGLKYGPQVRGSIVHHQIQLLCDGGSDYAKYYTYMDNYTKVAMSWIKDNGHIPISNEVPIADPDTGIATAIDMIVYDPTEQIFMMVELKTGNMDYFMESKTGLFRHLDMENSLFNQAKLQLTMTYHIFKKNYSNDFPYKISKFLILHIGNESSYELFISEKFMQIKGDIYDIIKLYR